MKKLLVALVVMMSVGALNAQIKIGHINSTKLLDTLPSRKAAIKTLEEFGAAGENELKEAETALQAMYNKYQKDGPTLSPIMRQYEEERIQKKQQELQIREQELQQQMSMLSNELNAPILKRMQKAVDIVAERRKMNYIFDESQAIFSKGGTDLTNEVMIELLALDAADMKKASGTTPVAPEAVTPKK
ncbi:MAG: OmpH family outer membrane protein [Crocinitomicaceae bacterium]|nr:MAG: OmpH family outer membrane protein [Crocinitomicaceae bacterium]